MDAWLTLLAALGPAVAQALYDVSKEVVVKPLTGPAAEQVKRWVRRGYDAKVEDAKVRQAVADAAEASGLAQGVGLTDYPLQRALHRLADEGRDALRRQAVAAALVMTS